MKKFGFLFFTLFVINSASAQQTEFSFHLNSGFFSFAGESATKNSIIIVSDVATIDNYTNNPYGKEQTFSYGLAVQAERITQNRWIIALQAGYEILRSRVHINGVSGEFLVTPEIPEGNTVLSHGFINLYPHAGKRLVFGEIEADLAIGPEFGFNTFSREKGEAYIERGWTIETDTERKDPGTDIRFRSNVTVYYKNWGMSAGYSYGLHNYSGNLTGAEREHYSRFARFGITYRIK